MRVTYRIAVLWELRVSQNSITDTLNSNMCGRIIDKFRKICYVNKIYLILYQIFNKSQLHISIKYQSLKYSLKKLMFGSNLLIFVCL